LSDIADTTEPPKSAAEQIGDEWAEMESPRAEGWLGAEPAEPETPAEDAPPQIEAAPDRTAIAAVGADPDELEAFLADNPDVERQLASVPGWTPEPTTAAEVSTNSAILSNLLGEAHDSKAAKRELLDEAMQHFEAGEDPAAIADALQGIDPGIAELFANQWRVAEAEPTTALEWLQGQNQVKAFLDLAAQTKQEAEAAEKAQAQAKGALEAGIAAFEKGFTDRQRAPLGDAVSALSALHEHGIDFPTESPEAVEGALRVTLALAKEWDEAQREARTSAEWEKNNPDYIGGYMTEEKKPRTYDEHLKAEVEKSAEDNPDAYKYPLLKAWRDGTLSDADFQLPVTTAEDHAKMLADTFDKPSPNEAEFEKFNGKPASQKPVEEDKWFGDHESVLQSGWNVG
jgi:copper chaperone CopZ